MPKKAKNCKLKVYYWAPCKTVYILRNISSELVIFRQISLFFFKHLSEIIYIQFFKDSYNDLYKWSTDNYVKFWEEFWHFSKIIHSKSYSCVLEKESGPVDNFPFKWFDGALLNYAENLLKYNDERVAVYSFGNFTFCSYFAFVYECNFFFVFCYLGEAFTQIKSG